MLKIGQSFCYSFSMNDGGNAITRKRVMSYRSLVGTLFWEVTNKDNHVKDKKIKEVLERKSQHDQP